MIAYFLFAGVMLVIYLRPFGIPIWLVSVFGALFALAFGIVNLRDVWFVWIMVWDSTLVLVGLIVLTLALERILFFDFLAYKILCFTGENRESSDKGRIFYCKSLKLFIFLILFGAFLAIFLANDGAILVLTPLMFALFPHKRGNFYAPLIIFLLFMGFISDFASNLFVLSNLTNILTASFFAIPFAEFLRFMALPQVFAILASLLVFWCLLGLKLPQKLVLTSHFKQESLSKFGICFCFVLLALLPICAAIGAYFEIPLCFFVGFCAILAVGYGIKLGRIAPLQLLKESPFSVVVFSLGLFVVVFGLKNAGLLEILQIGIVKIMELERFLNLLSIGFLSAFGSSIINNLPMVMLGDLALKEVGDSALVFAHLLGCNIGSKFTPIGSLATLLWLVSLRRYGILIPIFRYLTLAFCFSAVVLFCAIVGLYFSCIFLV
ncbi:MULTISPECIES: arsenic transporter [Helicobacter]|uniref:arsenic transporter n=1 Tax=Helicobacter TaxID=209 RepID=UPI00261D22C6|nr:arsenic transporter [Helicobacter sp. UBA3407]